MMPKDNATTETEAQRNCSADQTPLSILNPPITEDDKIIENIQ